MSNSLEDQIDVTYLIRIQLMLTQSFQDKIAVLSYNMSVIIDVIRTGLEITPTRLFGHSSIGLIMFELDVQ